MSWARIDDQSAFNMKVLFVGNAAWGALCRMVAHSCSALSDGFISSELAHTIASPEELAKLLSPMPNGKAAMLQPADGGYVIHDFHHWNPYAAEVRSKREAEAKRKEEGRKNQVRGPNGRMSARTPAGRPQVVRPDTSRTTSGSPAGRGAESEKLPPVPSPSPSPSVLLIEGQTIAAGVSEPEAAEPGQRTLALPPYAPTTALPEPVPPDLAPTEETVARCLMAARPDPRTFMEDFLAVQRRKGATSVSWQDEIFLFAGTRQRYEASNRNSLAGFQRGHPSPPQPRNPASRRPPKE